MSATFKNAKKMVKQEQLRKIMKEHKKIQKDVKKIDSPLAKYNDAGQLTCILCKSVVKSEAVWVVHINAKQHKENIELAKKLKERTNNFTTPLKRSLTPPMPEVPEKKVKGILKNVPQNTSMEPPKPVATTKTKGSKKDKSNLKPPLPEVATDVDEEMPENGKLPEGFFDDPKMDAKARNQEYKDPMGQEWDKFLKEMKIVETESEAIISEDQDESTNERHIEEIDQQMMLFNRVLDLEKKKEETIEVVNKLKSEPMIEEEEIDEDLDEFLDWRQKKLF